MTSTAAQEAFLQAFHAERPAVTAEALGASRAPDGRTSYELLSARVAGRDRVLDLGCGDGLLLEVLARDAGRRLAGVDLSSPALTLARQRPALAEARLAVGRAQQLPFADGTFDACACHMALMLMGEIEQVAAEIARVLSPDGRFAWVIGGGGVGDEAYARFTALLRAALRDVPAAQQIPRLGDVRTRSRAGLEAILGQAGFDRWEWESVPLDLSGPVEQVWAAVSGVYDLGPLDPPLVARLRTEFLAEVRELTAPDGTVPCGFTVHLGTARLAPAP